jgi:hypothetical protein
MVVPTTYKERLIMFDWFRNLFGRREYPTWKDVPAWNKVNDDMEKISKDMSKVVQFPEVSKTLPMPEIKLPAEGKKPAQTIYRLGITDDNRVSFQMGYSEITMNKQGVDNLIQQLAVFRDQLQEDTEEDIND